MSRFSHYPSSYIFKWLFIKIIIRRIQSFLMIYLMMVLVDVFIDLVKNMHLYINKWEYMFPVQSIKNSCSVIIKKKVHENDRILHFP